MNQSSELDAIFRHDMPLLDVRAPVEFQKGAFPTSTNLPILNDEEREQVGICYKDQGPDAAVDLGHQLVAGLKKDTRIAQWIEYIDRHANAMLYCYRGGQRSGITSQWLHEAGYDLPRISGGYKRMRNHLLSVLEDLPPLLLVSGKTGSGKTEFLDQFDGSIDLEGLANHRGSAFGRRIEPQPGQIDFENGIAIEFIKKSDQPFALLEDEGRLIGRVHLPLPLQERMKAAPILVIEESVDHRAERIHQEYIQEQWLEYETHYGDNAAQAFGDYLLGAADAIKKRLGGVAHAEVRALMTAALATQASSGVLDDHLGWISTLLRDYYDPMYNYQLSKKSDRVKATATRSELRQWLGDNRDSIHG
jgi:tRNA 2-selenouridine synthase